MRFSLTIGKISNIPLKIHYNWFIVAGLVTWSLAKGYFPHEYPGWATHTYWIAGLITATLFFFSVLVHELGHSLVAQNESVPVKSITLFILGGVAHIANEPETARSEFRIVVAGPFSSLLMASVFILFASPVFFRPEISGPALYLSHINIILAVFNLIPGFPLDGGRLLRATIWQWNDDFIRATRWAIYTGIGIALLFIAGGLLLLLRGNYLNGVWIAFIGWYLASAGQLSYRQTVASFSEVPEIIEIITPDNSKTVPGPFARPLAGLRGELKKPEW